MSTNDGFAILVLRVLLSVLALLIMVPMFDNSADVPFYVTVCVYLLGKLVDLAAKIMRKQFFLMLLKVKKVNSMMIYVTVFAILIVGSILAAIGISLMFRKVDTINLIQGKLANSDSAIADAMPYLKITNEWSK